MKKHLAFFLLFFLALSGIVLAQENVSTSGSSESRIVIYEVNRLNAGKTLPMFKEFIADKTGISIKGFCESRNLLLLEANDEGKRACEQWFREMSFPFYEKQSVPVADAMNSCDGDGSFSGTFKNE